MKGMTTHLHISPMLKSDLKNHIERQQGFTIHSMRPLTGGDINQVGLLDTDHGKIVIKINDAQQFPGMFAAEKTGLDTLRRVNAIHIPRAVACGAVDDTSYLLLEYIEPGTKQSGFWEVFGHQLAQLHKTGNDFFGFCQNNYIGSLPQYNNQEQYAVDLYINQRLKPQFKMASANGYHFDNLDNFYAHLHNIIPDEPPALVHGDLWGGNYLVDYQGNPVLIDPATAYAPREMDIAMMHLFGGFDPRLFVAYHSVFPLQTGWQDRIKLWQLYYILVHLNLFGHSYLASAKAIIAHYR